MEVQQNTDLSIDTLTMKDVMYKLILPMLNVKDWVNLLDTSKVLREVLNSFFIVNRRLDLSACTGSISWPEFRRVTEASTNLRVLRLPDCSWVTDQRLRPVLRLSDS